MSEIAEIITATAALIAAVGTIISVLKITQVNKEVKTGNSQTLAQLADAIEGRRIDKISEKNRTPLEKSHLVDTKE